MFDFIPTETIEVEAYGQPLRITMRAVGALGFAKVNEMRRALTKDVSSLDDAQLGSAQFATLMTTYRACATFVSLTKMEIKKGGKWQELVPTSPADLGAMPNSVMVACEQAYCRLNPGDLFPNFEAAINPQNVDDVTGEPGPVEDADQKKDETPTETDLLTTPSA